MSQKTNPTSLRLHPTNQNWSWPLFADFFFTENYHYGLESEKYITAFLKQTQYSFASFSPVSSYKSFQLWFFFQDSRNDKAKKQWFLENHFSSERRSRPPLKIDFNKRKFLIGTAIKKKSSKLRSASDKSSSKIAVFQLFNLIKAQYKVGGKKWKQLGNQTSGLFAQKNFDATRNQWVKTNCIGLSLIHLGFSPLNTIKKYGQHLLDSSAATLATEVRAIDFFGDKKIAKFSNKPELYKLFYGVSTFVDFSFFPKEKIEVGALQSGALKTSASRLVYSKSLKAPLIRDFFRMIFYSVGFDKNRAHLPLAMLQTRYNSKNCKWQRETPQLGFMDLNTSHLGTTARTNHSFLRTVSFAKSDSVIVNLEPICFAVDRQNVMSLLDQIVFLLLKRVSARRVKSFLFKQLSRLEVSGFSQISGVRFSCSGRLGGGSKKAQKAKTESASFGPTSLSSFSSPLIFGSHTALTRYGKIGVKLWITFKKNTLYR